MTVKQMRARLLKVRPYSESVKWIEKVHGWHDAQVIAVYHKFKNEGRFDKKAAKQPHQMNLAEFGVDLIRKDETMIEKTCDTCEYMDERKDMQPCSVCIYNKNYISHYKMHRALKATKSIKTEVTDVRD